MWLLHLSVLRLSGAAWWDMTNATGTQSDTQQADGSQARSQLSLAISSMSCRLASSKGG